MIRAILHRPRTLSTLGLLAILLVGVFAFSTSIFGRPKLNVRTGTTGGPGMAVASTVDLRSLRTLQGFQAIWKSVVGDDASQPPGEEGTISLGVSVDTFENGTGTFMKPNAFEPDAQLKGNGQGVELTFRAERDDCAPGVTEQVKIIVTQESTGGIATSIWTAGCGAPSKIAVVAHAVKGSGGFEAGAATACALRVVRQNGKVIESFHWCRDVKLK